MNESSFFIKYKIDFTIGFLILFIICLSIYVNKYRSDFVELTNEVQRSSQIGNKLLDLNLLLQNNQLIFNEIANYKTNDLQKYYSEQRKIIDTTLQSLESLVSAQSNSTMSINSIRNMFSDYFKVLETKVQDNSVWENQANQFSLLHNQIRKMFFEEDANFRNYSSKMDLSKSKSINAAMLLILIVLVVLTVLYVKIKNDVKVQEKNRIQVINKSLELDEMNRNKEKLFSIIAHDLRSPFHPILLISELLMTINEHVERKEIINLGEKLKSVGEGVLNLLDNLLAWSRIQTGTLRFNSELFSLKEKVDLALFNLKMEADKKKISTYNEVGDNLWIISDHNILLSLLQNLISNSIKFTNSGGSIRITGNVEKENVEICVTDTGIGMPPEITETIFNNALTQPRLGTNQEKGSGLGLLLCKEYVELHQGKIWVESEPGKGSSFSFTIPGKVISNKEDQFTYFEVKSIHRNTRKGFDLISAGI